MVANKVKYPQILSDKERLPAFTDLRFLESLWQHRFAPRFNFKTGDRLSIDDCVALETYKQQLFSIPLFSENSIPDWVQIYVDECRKKVPWYRNRPAEFLNQPTLSRNDIRKFYTEMVPDTVPINRCITYDTSGTTGAPLHFLSDPVHAASYLVQIEKMLEKSGITLDKVADRVSIACICDQKTTITYATLSTYLQGAGVIKINLPSDEWNSPDDSVRFLNELNPPVLTGDPLAFMSLAQLPVLITPRVLISSASMLGSGIRKQLETRFKCPVFDLYSMTECRCIAASTGNDSYRIFRSDLYIEILDKDGGVLPPGELGEITITGDNNPYLPLIRYKTGDYAALEFRGGSPWLVNFQGRKPVILFNSKKSFVNSIDINQSLCDIPIAQFTLHQKRDYSVCFEYYAKTNYSKEISETLNTIFGDEIAVHVILKNEPDNDKKTINFISEFDSAEIRGKQ